MQVFVPRLACTAPFAVHMRECEQRHKHPHMPLRQHQARSSVEERNAQDESLPTTPMSA